MKKLLSLLLSLLFVAVAAFMTSCDDDEDPIEPPTVTAPASTSVQVNNSVSVNFSVSTPGGYKSAATSGASGGTASITAQPSAGDESGTVTVEFTAGSTAGAGSVNLTVTDNADQTDVATAVFSISESAVPSISGVPSNATITKGDELSVDVDLAAADGISEFTVTSDVAGEIFSKSDFAGATSETVTVAYTPDAAGTEELTFEVTDTDGDNATFVHTLIIETIPNEVISGNIEEDMTWTNDRIWELASKVFVTNGATLKIEPGTIIKSRPGEGINATGLYIARDGMIDAVGTPDEPIIFTAKDDNIEVGQLAGTNLDADDNQLWGGVVILGNAPISPDAGTEAQIEGVPASETLGLYGGDQPNDNRGKFKYVSIRHGGTTIDPSAGADINGLTLGGVGADTEISHIEIFANFDDGVEFFGGNVDLSNLLVYTIGDDAIDIDQAYAGTVDNFMIFTSTAATSDEGLEIDGPEGPENAAGKFTVQNGTITSVDGGGSAADFKSRAQGTVSNVKWSGFDGGSTIQIRASFDEGNACADKTDAYTNLIDDELVFNTVEFDAVVVYDGDDEDACDVPASHQTSAEGKVSSETASGVTDATVFDGWTLSSIKQLLP